MFKLCSIRTLYVGEWGIRLDDPVINQFSHLDTLNQCLLNVEQVFDLRQDDNFGPQAAQDIFGKRQRFQNWRQ
jgi:hypothetical protein